MSTPAPLRSHLGSPFPSLCTFCTRTLAVALALSLTRAYRYLQAFAGFPDHPHRGFETCSIMLEGVMEHRDSQGNQVCARAGEAPMHAASLWPPLALRTRPFGRVAVHVAGYG